MFKLVYEDITKESQYMVHLNQYKPNITSTDLLLNWNCDQSEASRNKFRSKTFLLFGNNKESVYFKSVCGFDPTIFTREYNVTDGGKSDTMTSLPLVKQPDFEFSAFIQPAESKCIMDLDVQRVYRFTE